MCFIIYINIHNKGPNIFTNFFHKIRREAAAALLVQSGNFLVRENIRQRGQYVLSAMQNVCFVVSISSPSFNVYICIYIYMPSYTEKIKGKIDINA